MPSHPELTHLLPTSEVVWRLGVATLIGGIIGLDRERRGKPAGLRTQALVSLGCATATLVISELASVGDSYDVGAVSRVIQGVLTGVGFFGGGVILRDARDLQVQGLTTAATIWVAATLGVASGVGLWQLALAVLVLALVILHLGVRIEGQFRRRETPPPKDPPRP